MQNSKCSTSCECCMMPFSKDPLGENRESPKYCSYCFSDGKLHANEAKDMREFQNKVFEGMRKGGHSWIMAKIYAWSIQFAPYWKERNKKK